jgi:hypothetical protein
MSAERAPMTGQLRSAIDREAAGEKVDYHDSAAAPLGADEEAGGRAPSPAETPMSLGQELSQSLVEAQPRPTGRRSPLVLAAALAALCIILAAVAWGLWAR